MQTRAFAEGPFIEQDEAVALLPQPDVRFFRNTGLALVTATLMAGAITLSLTLTENRSVILALQAQTKEPAEIIAAEVTESIQTDYQEEHGPSIRVREEASPLSNLPPERPAGH